VRTAVDPCAASACRVRAALRVVRCHTRRVRPNRRRRRPTAARTRNGASRHATPRVTPRHARPSGVYHTGTPRARGATCEPGRDATRARDSTRLAWTPPGRRLQKRYDNKNCERALLSLSGKEIKASSRLRHEWERSALAVVVRRPLRGCNFVRLPQTSSMANWLVDRRHHIIMRRLIPCEQSVVAAHTACGVAVQEPLKVSKSDRWKI